MSSLLDKAYERQMSHHRSVVVADLIRLEKEIRAAQKGMKESWERLCEFQGVKPEEVKSLPVMEVKDDYIALSETCLSYTREFAEKLNEYKKLCRDNGITPNPKIVKTNEVITNERSESNDRKGDVAATTVRQRQPGHRNNRRFPSRRTKKHRHNK